MQKYYDFLDSQINEELKINTGFISLVSEKRYPMDQNEINSFYSRYNLIKKFQEISLSLFHKSLNNEEDPEIADLVLNELPDYIGREYHKTIPFKLDQTPVFFRTDEVIPGKISEIQSPGSAWGIYEQLFNFYNHFKELNNSSTNFTKPLSFKFTKALGNFLKKEPVVHHLIDNASVPNGIRYFVQSTRKHGLKYFGYDKDITSYDSNFIRAHAFLGLISDNFREFRFQKYKKQELLFDLFPSILFDQKMPIVFPFHKKTRHFFSDEIREMFPFTSLVTPDGIETEENEKFSIEDFCTLPQSKRNYFLKYAGSDLEINWGSKSVYYIGNESAKKCKEILKNILSGYKNKKYWIIQKAYFTKEEEVNYISRENNSEKDRSYSKFSGFYGPEGVMGILVMQKKFKKVHGSPDTVMTIV